MVSVYGWSNCEAEQFAPEDVPMTAQDLLELLLTLPEDARRITVVECQDGGYDSMWGALTREGVELLRNPGRWELMLTGDPYCG